MDSLERIRTALNFGVPDRVPVIPQIFGHAGIISGVPLHKYIKDGELIAQCQINAVEKYGYDAVFTVMDANVETEACGSVLEYRKDMYSFVKNHIISNSNWSNLMIPDPHKDGRMPEMLKSLRILRKKIGDEYLVVGCIMGPMTLTTQLIGAEEALYLAIDEPENFQKILQIATEIVIEFGLAQIEAGAHLPIVFDPSASPAMIPPQFFREIELPQLQKVFEAFAKAGTVANWLHIAGPVTSILPYYPEIGVNIANFDYYVSPEKAVELLPNICLDGNIKSVCFIEDTPDEISTKASELLDFFASRSGYILSSGCEISPEAKPENIAAMVKAAEQKRGI